MNPKTDVAVYKGKKRYLCCPGCNNPIKEDPGKYFKG